MRSHCIRFSREGMVSLYDILLTVLIKQHFASHQDPNLEVSFGCTTDNPYSNFKVEVEVADLLLPRSPSLPFSNVFDGFLPLRMVPISKCSLLEGSPKVLPKI